MKESGFEQAARFWDRKDADSEKMAQFATSLAQCHSRRILNIKISVPLRLKVLQMPS